METIQPYEGREAYIFISYSHEDENAVLLFLEAMNREGYRLWYDKGIPLGKKWKKVIASKIQNCAACIIFYSNAVKKSKHCGAEMDYITRQEKPVTLFYLEDIPLPPDVDMYLGSVQSAKKSECPTPEEFIERLKRSESFRRCKGELHAQRRGAERAEREDEAGAQSANAQSELSASPEFLPVFAVQGDIPRPSGTAAGTGTNETAVVIHGDIPRPSETAAGAGTKKARKSSPRIRAVYVNGVERYVSDSFSIAQAMRLTFEAVFNDYLGVNPAPEKLRIVGGFVGINQTFLRFEAFDGAQFVAKAPLYLNGFSSPVYLATTNDTPTKRKRVTRLCRYLHDKEGQKSRVKWVTTDGNLWLWRPDTDYEMESVSDSGS